MLRQLGIALVGWVLALPVGAQMASVLDEPATQVAGGGTHTCALTTAGAVKCWGENLYGQLGDGSTTDSATPVSVPPLAGGVAAIGSGSSYSCALTTAGGVQCWGYNGNGRLGDGSTTNSLVPVDVSGLTSGVAAIATGPSHACALTSAGAVKCWGANASGQLGDGSTTDEFAPVDVVGLVSGVVALAAGQAHSCALTRTGGVKCWGENSAGELGNGTTTPSPTPVDVPNLGGGAVAIATGLSHSCALTAAGAVKCWGADASGQLGDGANSNQPTPVDVLGLAGDVVAISANGDQTCALTTAGAMKCWGSNSFGQLGNGTVLDQSIPVDVTGLTQGVAAISNGGFWSCATVASGGVKCWGQNNYGQLGDGSTTDRTTAVDVAAFSAGATAISAGGWHSCALNAANGALCWGRSLEGQIGDGGTLIRYEPAAVSGLASGLASIVVGRVHSCALTEAGAVKCWGSNANGQVGDNSTTDRPEPVDVNGLAGGVAALTAGGFHNCALMATGGVKCWGYNSTGQLGNNSAINSSVPVDVMGLGSDVIAISAGSAHTCAVMDTGAVKCWGYNSYGQLGDGNAPGGSLVPVDVTALAGVAEVVAGGEHSCARTTTGAVKCWGRNNQGQLGDNSTTDSTTAIDVPSLTGGVAGLVAGYSHNCVLMSAGGVKCWGDNDWGQLGVGDAIDRLVPTDLTALGNAGAMVSAGYRHSCASTTDGVAHCWGNNGFYQLGNNVSGDRDLPIPLLVGQSLDFTPSATLPLGANMTLTATATGGGAVPIIFSVWTPETCVLSGNTLSATSLALCGVRAARARGSDGAYGTHASTPQQLRLIRVTGLEPTLALASSANPSVYGQNVTFTATVGNTGSPTGNIVLCADATTPDATCSGGALLCTADITASPIQCSAANLAVGSRAITAFYVGDLNHEAATSPVLTQVVNLAATTTSVSAPGPIVLGDSVLVTAGVAVTAPGAGSPSGSIVVDDGSANCTITLPATTCTLTPVSVGSKTVAASYSGDGNFQASSQTTSLLVNPPPAGVVVVSSVNPSVYGQSVAFTATVTGTSPSGSVTFRDGTSVLCASVTLAGGVAVCSSSTLTAGSHAIAADYSGDANNGAATSPVLTQVVNPAATTTSVSAPGPIALGDSLLVTAGVAVTAPGAGSPSGSIVVDDGSANCTITLPATTCTLTPVSVGGKTVTASYSGDGNFQASSQTTSLLVNPPPASVVVVSSVNPSVYGQSVAFTATVTGTSPSGSVTFRDGASVLCASVTLAGGVAGCSSSTLTVGSHAIAADYSGDANNGAATSPVLTQVVNPAATTTSVSAPGPIVLGDSVLVAAGVAVTAPGAGSPSGSIAVDDGSAHCTITLPATTCTLTPVSVGSKTVTASYSGDGNFQASSQTTSLLVNPPPAGVVVVSSVNPSVYGQSVAFTATVTGTSPSGSVTFRDGTSVLCASVTLAGGVAVCSSSTLTAGSHAIAADYSGDANNGAATSPALTQVVSQATQTIDNFASPGPQVVGAGPLAFAPTASSGLAVALVSDTPAVCTVSGSGPYQVTFLAVGTCTLTASQAGDTNWAPVAASLDFAVMNAAAPRQIPTAGWPGLLLLLAGLLAMARVGKGRPLQRR